MRLALLLSLTLVVPLAGCAGTQGNRRAGRPMVTRAADLRKHVGRPVTLVGTARVSADRADPVAALDLRGGTVLLPAYTWPDGFDDRPVSVSGLLLADDPERGVDRVYRLGEIENAARWSR